MKPKRRLFRLIGGWWLVLMSAPPALAVQERWLVLPFDHLTDNAEFNWLGEGFAQVVSDSLSSAGVEVLAPAERRAGLEALAFPDTTILSRALALRLAQELGAGLLLVGTYKVTGSDSAPRLEVSARLINVRAGKMARAPFQVKAPLADLAELQAMLAWEILFSHRVPLTVSRRDFLSRFRGIPVRALEAYVKAQLIDDPSDRVQMLQAAVKAMTAEPSAGPYSPIMYELGKALYDQEKYGAAASRLKEVRPGRLFYREAQFYLGLCSYHQKDLESAAAIFHQLSRSVPATAVVNNLAVVEIKRKQFPDAVDHLILALAADRENATLWFNYGYALWLNGDDEAAAEKLRQSLEYQPDDGVTHYLLSRCLARLGRRDESQAALRLALEALPEVAEWERMGRMPDLARLEEEFDRAPLLRANRFSWEPDTSGFEPPPARWPDQMLGVTERLMGEGRDDEALTVVKEVLARKPESARAHYLKGRIHERQNELPEAMAELRAAAFWDPESVEAYVALGGVYHRLGQTHRAMEFVRKALSLEPDNRMAVNLQRRLAGEQDH